MDKKLIVGVMGGGNVSTAHYQAAYRLGQLIAKNGWVLLNGGRNSGIMEASAKGAHESGGLTIGILPDNNRERLCPFIQIPIITGMGNARNSINVLSSDIVVACPGGLGTISEIALALKVGKTVICLDFNPGQAFAEHEKSGRLLHAKSPEKAIERIRQILSLLPPSR